jgi:hypothetical protein
MVTFQGSPKLWPISHWDEKGSNPNAAGYFESSIKITSWLEGTRLHLPLCFFLPFHSSVADKFSERSYFACQIGNVSLFKEAIPVTTFHKIDPNKALAQKELTELCRAKKKEDREAHAHNLKLILQQLSSSILHIDDLPDNQPFYTQEEFTPFAQALNLTQEEIAYFVKNRLIPNGFIYTPLEKSAQTPLALKILALATLLGIGVALFQIPRVRKVQQQWIAQRFLTHQITP